MKQKEQIRLGWNLKRTLSKINYNIHTDAIKESYNTNKYNPNNIVNPQVHIPTPSIPIMLGTYRESYESLKKDYLNEIDDYFDYELIEKGDMVILKHSQKLIKAKENLLFPCRIFLKEPIEKIQYIICTH